MTAVSAPWAIERVEWDDERAVGLRAAMGDEISPIEVFPPDVRFPASRCFATALPAVG
ncbi:MAG: hypothetical protein PIR02_04385 [Microbacterium enclense]